MDVLRLPLHLSPGWSHWWTRLARVDVSREDSVRSSRRPPDGTLVAMDVAHGGTEPPSWTFAVP